jgi:hypothetical protein
MRQVLRSGAGSSRHGASSIDDDRYVAQTIDPMSISIAIDEEEGLDLLAPWLPAPGLSRSDADELATAFKAVADAGRLQF